MNNTATLVTAAAITLTGFVLLILAVGAHILGQGDLYTYFHAHMGGYIALSMTAVVCGATVLTVVAAD